MSQFAKNIKKRRKEKELTQEEFADRLKVSRTCISNWETGNNYPDFCLLVNISNVLDISLDVLIKEDYELMQYIEDNEKRNKKRNRILAILIPVVCIFMIGFIINIVQLNASDISKDEIKTATVKDGVLTVEVDLNGFETLDGWMLEGNRDEATLCITKVFNLANGFKNRKSNSITIPLDEWDGVNEFILSNNDEILKVDYIQ